MKNLSLMPHPTTSFPHLRYCYLKKKKQFKRLWLIAFMMSQPCFPCSPHMSRVVSVVFDFNASLNAFIPESPIAFTVENIVGKHLVKCLDKKLYIRLTTKIQFDK